MKHCKKSMSVEQMLKTMCLHITPIYTLYR